MPGTDTDVPAPPAVTDTPGMEIDTPGIDTPPGMVPEKDAPPLELELDENAALPLPAIATPRFVPDVTTVVPFPFVVLDAATLPGPVTITPWPDPDVTTVPPFPEVAPMTTAGHGIGSVPSPAAYARVGCGLICAPSKPAVLMASAALAPTSSA